MKKTFKNHLLGKGHSQSTTESIEKSLYLFLNWAEDQNLESEQTSYTELIAYMKYMQSRGIQQKTVYSHINALRHYFDWVITRNLREDNPAGRIEVKGIKRRSLHVIIPRTELERLYESFSVSKEPSTLRNRCMLGLIIWQALGTHELQALKLPGLKLREGKVFIAGSRKSVERKLKLEPTQILDLMEYLHKVRPQLLNGKQSDQLFISGRANTQLQGVMAELMKKIRKQNPKIKSLNQVRASVITHWLKTHNLRQVQNMAGHKYISSTESYLINDLEGLQEDIGKFHPLG